MFQDSPIFSLFSLAVAAYLFALWLGDFRHFARTRSPRKGAFEGARPAPARLVGLGVVLALCLLGLSSSAEILTGVSQGQTKVAPFAIFSWLGAAFVEELIFRGYLVVKNRGRAALVLSIIFFSLVFALGHPFLWNYEVPEGASIFGGVWSANITLQAGVSTATVLCCSLLFYALRFAPSNAERSILPCICAHAAYNIGVFAVKAAQGFVQW